MKKQNLYFYIHYLLQKYLEFIYSKKLLIILIIIYIINFNHNSFLK
jgi:hypothetical protein